MIVLPKIEKIFPRKSLSSTHLGRERCWSALSITGAGATRYWSPVGWFITVGRNIWCGKYSTSSIWTSSSISSSSKTPFFIGRTHFCTTNLCLIWLIFRRETYIHFVAQETRNYQKIIYFFIFSSKKVEIGDQS